MVKVFHKTMDHFFPSFLNWMRMINDPREQGKIEYPLANLVWVRIFLFLLKLESRRQIKYRNVLEAKLVTANGPAIFVETEFIENPHEGVSKQDCELKAFYRLVKKLKRDFPQLNICLLLDGLYAVGPVFDICKNYHWKYLVTFKEGSMSDVYAEYMNLRALYKDTLREVNKSKIRQKFKR